MLVLPLLQTPMLPVETVLTLSNINTVVGPSPCPASCQSIWVSLRYRPSPSRNRGEPTGQRGRVGSAPRISTAPRSDPNSPIILIAEKIADAIKESS